MQSIQCKGTERSCCGCARDQRSAIDLYLEPKVTVRKMKRGTCLARQWMWCVCVPSPISFTRLRQTHKLARFAMQIPRSTPRTWEILGRCMYVWVTVLQRHVNNPGRRDVIPGSAVFGPHQPWPSVPFDSYPTRISLRLLPSYLHLCIITSYPPNQSKNPTLVPPGLRKDKRKWQSSATY